jgi:Starter unit:ACP transacylase in aflatoxin biosynthesis
MDRLVIPVFSGQGSASFDSRRVQDQALICSSSHAGTLLLSSCFQAFHSDLSSLSDLELEMTGVTLTDFDQPFTLLVVPPKKYARNPVVSGTRLLLIQALIYLEWATRTVGEASDDTLATLLERNRRHRVGVVGFSSGIISACVVGTSATLLDYLSNAASAFRVALWIGVRTQCYQIRTLAAPASHANDDHSWSRILLGMGYHATEEAISRFCLQVSTVFQWLRKIR